MGLTYAISIVNWILGSVLLKSIFLFFFTNFILLMSHNNSENFRKFEQVEVV